MYPLEESIKFTSLMAIFVAESASNTDQGWPGKLRIPVMILFSIIGTVIFALAAAFKVFQPFEFFALMAYCFVSWNRVGKWYREKIVPSRTDAS
jgi:hypothetical protein